MFVIALMPASGRLFADVEAPLIVPWRFSGTYITAVRVEPGLEAVVSSWKPERISDEDCATLLPKGRSLLFRLYTFADWICAPVQLHARLSVTLARRRFTGTCCVPEVEAVTERFSSTPAIGMPYCDIELFPELYEGILYTSEAMPPLPVSLSGMDEVMSPMFTIA